MANDLKSVIYRFSQPTISAYNKQMYITYGYLEYTYIPTDYGEKKSYEKKLAMPNEWSKFNSMNLTIVHNGTTTGKVLRIYNPHIEVEYWPVTPDKTPVVTCDVEGLYDTADALTGTKGQYPESVMRNIIRRWLLRKSAITGMEIDTTTFTDYTTGENYVDLYVDQPVKVLDLLAKISYENRRWLTFFNLVWKVWRRPDAATVVSDDAPDWTIDDGDIIRHSFSVIPRSVAELVTSVTAKCRYDHSDKGWLTIDELDVSPAPTYWEKELVFENWSHCQSTDTTVPQYYLDEFSEMKPVYSFSTGPEGIKLIPGDILKVSYSPLGIVEELAIVLSVTINVGSLMSGEPLTVAVESVKVNA